MFAGESSFLWHFPSGRPAQPLAGILPYGARTFLTPKRAIVWPCLLYTSNPNLESIIALEPDFVIMTSGSGGRGGDSNQADLKAALAASNIPVACFQVTTFADYERMLRTCCDITGRDDLYEQNAQAVSERIKAITAKVPAGEAPTALVLTTFSGGTRVQASSTMTGAMLADLGVKNLADENPSLLKDFSLESIIEMNPDYIFVVPMGNDDAAAMKALEDQTAANPAWSTLDAVQNGRYVTLDPHLFQYKPNERWDQSYQVLFDALYAVSYTHLRSAAWARRGTGRRIR